MKMDVQIKIASIGQYDINKFYSGNYRICDGRLLIVDYSNNTGKKD